MSQRIQLAHSFVRSRLSGILSDLTFRPGPNGRSDHLDPPTDPTEIADIIENFRSSTHHAGETIYLMLALQWALTHSDEDLDRYARDDLYLWSNEARRHWLQRFYDALYPGISVPHQGPDIEIIKADNHEWCELRDRQADIAAEAHPLEEPQR